MLWTGEGHTCSHALRAQVEPAVTFHQHGNLWDLFLLMTMQKEQLMDAGETKLPQHQVRLAAGENQADPKEIKKISATMNDE